jgi:hypothetical protein
MSTSGAEVLGPFITNRFGDRYLYEVNRSAFDQVGSAAVYQKYFGEDLFQSNRLFVVVGTDSGLLLRYIQKQPLPEGTRYLFVELPAVIEALRAEGKLQDLPERIRVVSLQEAWTQAEDFQLQNYLFLGGIELRDSIAAMDANLPEYRVLYTHLGEQLQAIEWSTRSSLGSRDFILRQLENLAENRIPAIHLKDRFAGKTAVILGGGPSLDEILPWVRANKDRVAILAVSRISRRLLEFGLAPHLVFSVDPHDVSFDVSREMLHFWDRALFVHSHHVSPKLLGQWRGPSVYAGNRFPWPTPNNPINLSGTGPTVTNMALSVAVEMGFSQVVLAGVDLCYSQSGMTHASGSFESAVGPKLDNVLTVETNGGWRAETGPDYFKAIEVLNYQAGQAEKRGCRVINPARGAAKISNIRHLQLSEIQLDPLESPMWPQVLEFLPEDGKQQRLTHYCLVRVELERVQGQLEKIRELAGEALYCNKGLFGKHGGRADFKFKVRMDKIEANLDKNFTDLIPLVKKFEIRRFLKVIRLDEEKAWSDKDIEKAAEVYYEAYQVSAERLMEFVGEALARLEAREKEETAGFPLEPMSALWRRDGQPGRLHVWRDRSPDSETIIATQRELVAALDDEFNAMMTTTETVQAKRVRHQRSLSPLRSKALRLFKSRDRAGLEQMACALDLHVDQERAPLLKALVEGYIAELGGDYPAALEHYQALVGETFDLLTEDALRRIAFIGIEIQQVEFSQLALECLANAMFVYKPQYADLLRLLGQHQAAADLYVDYLEKAPSDFGVLLKLGQLYHSMGAGDAARQVFRMVLEQDPENDAARELLYGIA